MSLIISPQQAKGLVKTAKKLNKADAINMAVQVVGAVGVKFIETAYEVKNEKQRQKNLEDLEKLEGDEIAELIVRLNTITDSDKRLEEYTSFIANSLAKSKAKELSSGIEKKNFGSVFSDRKKIYTAIGVTLALFLTIIVVKKITK